MTYEEIKKHKEVKQFIKKGNQNLGILGYTDHSEVHCILVAERAAEILKAYFDIFLGRMMMCRKSAEILGAKFKLTVNGSKVL